MKDVRDTVVVVENDVELEYGVGNTGTTGESNHVWGYHLDRLSPPAAEQPMGNRSFRCSWAYCRLLYTSLLKQWVKNRELSFRSRYSDKKVTSFLGYPVTIQTQGHFTALNASSSRKKSPRLCRIVISKTVGYANRYQTGDMLHLSKVRAKWLVDRGG